MEKITIEQISDYLKDSHTITNHSNWYIDIKSESKNFHIQLLQDKEIWNVDFGNYKNKSSTLYLWEYTLNWQILVDWYVNESNEWQYHLNCLNTWSPHRTWVDSLSHSIHGLCSELYEVNISDWNELKDELGDVEYYLSHLTWHLGPVITRLSSDYNMLEIVANLSDVAKKVTHLQKWQEKQQKKYINGYTDLMNWFNIQYIRAFQYYGLDRFEVMRSVVQEQNIEKLSGRMERNEILDQI